MFFVVFYLELNDIMIKEIYGKKIGMTQIFDEQGNLIPLTLIETPPACLLEIIKYPTKTRVKIGCFKIHEKKVGKVKKPIKGYFDKFKVSPYKLLREVEIVKGSDFSFLSELVGEKVEEVTVIEESVKVSDISLENKESEKEETKEEILNVDSEDETFKEVEETLTNSREVGIEIFQVGDILDVRAKSQGKGFAGPMKRHNMRGQPAAHGHTMHRRTGSIGTSATPSRVYKGRDMPGHMGDSFVTTKNLKIIKIDTDKNILFIKGSIPGAKGAVIRLKKVC